MVVASAVGLSRQQAMPPAGYGSLRQDEIAVRIRSAALEVRLLPLEERVIRLLAPDAYRSLSALVNSRLDAIEAASRRQRLSGPSVMLVTVFALQPDVRFDAQQLQIMSRGQLFRPVEILPLTPNWNEQRIPQRVQLSAIYLFEPGIPTLEESFEVDYEGISSQQWQRSRRLLEAELAQVYVRASRDTGVVRRR